MSNIQRIVFLSHHPTFDLVSIEEATKTRNSIYSYLGVSFEKNSYWQYVYNFIAFYFSADESSLENVKIYSPEGYVFINPDQVKITKHVLEYINRSVKGVKDPIIVIYLDREHISAIVKMLLPEKEKERVGYLPGPASAHDAYICEKIGNNWKIKFCTRCGVSDENPVPNFREEDDIS